MRPYFWPWDGEIMKHTALGKVPKLFAHAWVALLIISIITLPVTASATGVGVGNNAGSTQNLTMVTAPTQNGNQTTAQQDAQKKSNDGSNTATITSLLTMAMGGMMIKEGTASCPSCNTMMIMMGSMMILQGMQGMQGAKALANSGAAQGANAGTMNGNDTAKMADTNGPGKASFSIDPSLLREGQLGSALDKVEKNLGIPRDTFANQAMNANSAGDLESMIKGGKGVGGISDKKLDDIFSAAAEKLAANPNATKDALAKAGIDLNSYGSGGGVAVASKSSARDTSFDDLLKGMNKDDPNAQGTGGILLNGEVSSDVQAALNKNGISDKSIFEMVRTQYKKQTPVLFGMDKKPASESDAMGLSAEAPKGI